METYLYKFLKKKCEEKGFVYGRLEDKADLSHSVVQAIRNGRTQLKPATKQKLAQALGCSIGDIQDAIRRSDEVLEDGEVVRSRTARMTTRWRSHPRICRISRGWMKNSLLLSCPGLISRGKSFLLHWRTFRKRLRRKKTTRNRRL